MLQTFNPLNKDLIVNINGRLVHRDEAGVSPFDSAVQNGDAVWEGLRLYDGRVFRLPQHLDRLRTSAELLQYQGYPEDEHLIDELKKTLAANRMTDGVHVRLTVSRGLKYTSGLDPRINQRGCSLFILPEHKPPVYDKGGVTLITASVRRPFADVLNQHIHSCNQLTSVLAKLEANAAGADDALLLDTRGHVAETNATHLFFVKGGAVLTPTTDACPTGITRATVLELCEAHGIEHSVCNLTRDQALACDEAFCTGTMGELVSVTKIDDAVINGARAGEITRRLSDLFRELTLREDQGTRVV